jgi:hypothetical protein
VRFCRQSSIIPAKAEIHKVELLNLIKANQA